jgi:hypothetical protein
MKVTKKHKEEAAKIYASNTSINALWVNKNGEFFTTNNLASLSVKGKKSDYAPINKIDVVDPEDAKDNFDHDAINTAKVVEGAMVLKGDDFELVFPNIKNKVREPKEGDIAEFKGKPADGKFVYEGTTMIFEKGALKTVTFKSGGTRSFFKNLVK